MFKLPVYFLSDSHFKMDIDQSEINRREKLYHVFEKIKSTGGTLIIGGDFFDFWFDYKNVVPNGYIDLFQQLNELYKFKINIHYVLGNHDYWDFGYFQNKFGAKVYQGDLEFLNNNSKIFISHGDGLLKNDYGYRFMKKIIRSKMCIFLFRNFHPDWGCELAKKISKSSESYNHHDLHSEKIRSELIEYAHFQWNQGIDTILLGHYHQIGIIENRKKKLIFLGDWLRHFTVTKLDNNGWWQGNWNEV
tara:strand:+ start:831 stop:1571 length:741 start_codon:yes stop_codon:yes gene_type:complete